MRPRLSHRLRLLSLLALSPCLLILGCGSDDDLAGAGGSGATSAATNAISTGAVTDAPPTLTSLMPNEVPGGLPAAIVVFGAGFTEDAVIEVDEAPVPTTFGSDGSLTAGLPPLAKGQASITVNQASGRSEPLSLSVQNAVPVIEDPGSLSIDEETSITRKIAAADFDGDPLHVTLTNLPPGAHWDETESELSFRPDFIQGGQTWAVTVTADDGEATVSLDFDITVNDTITPPWPTIVSTTPQAGYTLLVLDQKTDSFLDSPGYAGTSYEARVVIPDGADAASPMPVRVYLHGFGGTPYQGGASGQFRIYAHDPMNTYWWGYGDSLPGGAPTSGTVPNYTQRRVMHLLEWVQKNYAGVDREKTYATGGSMGGAGAAILGLLYGRHFAFVEATIGQMIAKNHRPSRQAQLITLWGDPSDNLDDGAGMGVWDRMDLTRALQDDPEARDQLVFTKHGKDDPTIHFGAVTMPSPLTQLSYYDVVEKEGIGHYAVWDEGGHGSADPVMPAGWWDAGWNPILDATTYLRRDRPFPAFSHASHNDDPGDGTGNGLVPFSPESGYAAVEAIAGDTGWTGDIAGALNRFLRWETASIVETRDALSIDLFVLDGAGGPPPQPGYPTTGDQLSATLPVVSDVTMRRTRAFRCKPGEAVAYVFGEQSGTVSANADGSVTVPSLPLSTSLTTLTLTRPGAPM